MEAVGRTTTTIINVSDMAPDWKWLDHEIRVPHLNWTHFSTQSHSKMSFLPKKDSVLRMLNANQAVAHSKNQPSVLVTHGPRHTFYGAQIASVKSRNLTHLAMSFNFSELPTGVQYKLMSQAYQQVDRFVVYSEYEKQYYAKYFELPQDKFDVMPWTAQVPDTSKIGEPIELGTYICAVGSQGRDYAVLFDAMRQLKHMRLVLVAKSENLTGLKIPDNVTVYQDIPLADCHNIIHYSQFMVLPIIDENTPCGLVTLIAGMLHHKAVLTTKTMVAKEYVTHEVTGHLVPQQDVAAMKNAIEHMASTPEDRTYLAKNAYEYAINACDPIHMIDYFKNYLAQLPMPESAKAE